MKIQLRQDGRKLTKTQRAMLERQLDFALARFGARIDRVIARFSPAAGVPGYTRCQLDVVVDAEHS